ncbi:iron-sulfur cluster-binding protein [candidate division WOR-3 bacterium JGI_Cruoil_03_51_56]|uniref:Iron-sulfur cluster-binding protein n=1 Tax=candidate division WOR-3 bacterium JGI_Cruoil_03_51_56 TaxID=1973747 RepID=A0A235BR37_UNCW3|nr:MAG: iron-sulfur cluster-binding protein [candidate division WOR-3 bacterium JGI_Cruoil_03_51_56]
MKSRSKVAVLFTKPETVLDDYRRLLKLAEIDKFLDKNATTILKDNISWHYPMPSANTTPWQLEGTILGLHDLGFKDISCVQNKTVVIDTFKGEDLNHYIPIFKHYNVPVLYNFKPRDIKWIPFQPKAEMLVLNHIYPQGIRIPDYFFGKNIVHLPTVKCHIYTTTTGAMKNAFGGLLSTYRHYTHTWIHETLVDLLAIQKEIHPGIFATMDGTTAGNGPGPRTMTPVIKNVILASGDQVAIDAVAAKLMGIDPFSIGYIRIAHERRLGVGDTREIEIVGDDISEENWHFEVGRSFHKFLGWLSWYGPTKFLQKLIFRTWLVNIPIFVSEFNHDYIHWPLKEKKIYERWCQETPWGQLFQQYAEKGHLAD